MVGIKADLGLEPLSATCTVKSWTWDQKLDQKLKKKKPHINWA